MQEFVYAIFPSRLSDGRTPENEDVCKARGIGELYGNGRAFRYDYSKRIAGNIGSRVASFGEAVTADDEENGVD